MSHEIDRVLALEDVTRRLRRHLEAEADERRALDERLTRVEARVGQAESDVKDAHDRVECVERPGANTKNEGLEPIETPEDLEPIEDERELGESGA